MASNVEINLKAVDMASASIEKVKGSMGGMGNVTSGLTSAFSSVAMAAGAAGVAYMTISQIIDKTINPYIEYVDQVQEFSRATGTTVEEASRLIQAGDDMRVSYESLRMMMRNLTKNGVEPNIESLKKLSEQYLKLAPGLDRAQFAQDKFGKAYLDAIKILEKGPDAIDKYYNSIEDGLIVSKDAVRAAEEWKTAVDDLGDSFTAFKNGVIAPILPYLTALVGSIKTTADSFKGIDFSLQGYLKAITLPLAPMKGFINALVGITQVATGAKEATEDYTSVGEAYIDEEEQKALATAALKAEQEKIKNQMSELALFMAGPVSKENKSYADDQQKIIDKYNEITARIIELNGMRTLTDKQREELAEDLALRDQLKLKYKEQADEHNLAMQRIMFDMLQQQMALDGLSQKEADVLMGIANKWGLVDDATKRLWDSMKEYTSSIDQSGLSADQLVAKIAAIQDKKVTVTMDEVHNQYINQYYNRYDRMNAGAANGMDMTIPPGFPNDSFRLGVQSGEHVQVTPAGKSPGKSVIVNITYNPTVSMMDKYEAQTKLKPFVEAAVRSALEMRK